MTNGLSLITIDKPLISWMALFNVDPLINIPIE
jgi:hypothetical protein